MQPLPAPFDTLSPGLHWAHVHGPDGRDALLIRWDQWSGTATLFDDGDREDRPERREDGSVWLHKWRVLRVDPVVRPTLDDNP